MFKIGCHLSVSKGFYHMGKEALSIGANTMQFFTRNPRGSKAKPIDEKDIEKFLSFCKDNNITSLLAHAPYTLNPCSSNPETREFALQTMEDDIRRLSLLGECMYNFHPGSHTGQGAETGTAQITELLNKIITPEQKPIILLETMAGKGTEMGRTFEEIAGIIEGVDIKEKIGVCLDTCHVHDGGYNIKDDLDRVLEEFDNVIGIEKLRAVHLNDSMNPCGAHKDRHEKIGEGHLGIEAFTKIINNKYLKDIPFYLETPNELDGYAKEIAMLKSLRTQE